MRSVLGPMCGGPYEAFPPRTPRGEGFVGSSTHGPQTCSHAGTEVSARRGAVAQGSGPKATAGAVYSGVTRAGGVFRYVLCMFRATGPAQARNLQVIPDLVHVGVQTSRVQLSQSGT
ncbi:unnamed protein product [Gadus morhua 'NCC']